MQPRHATSNNKEPRADPLSHSILNQRTQMRRCQLAFPPGRILSLPSGVAVMRLSFTPGAVAAAFVAGLSIAPAASAQPGGVAPACNLDANNPKELAMLELPLQKARSATTPEGRQAALRDMMKELDNKPERFAKNPAGYNLRMSQALGMWALEPTIGYTPTRAQIGMQTNPAEKIDIVAKLDESYKAIVATYPSCENEVKQLRQNETWLAVT